MRWPLKGTVINHWPAARGRNMMAGAISLNMTTADDSQSVRLVNNDPAGNFIAVWGCIIDFDPSASWISNQVFAYLGYGPDTVVINLAQNWPLSPTQATGPGGVKSVINDPITGIYPLTVLNHPGHWEWTHEWPLTYLPPGQSLQALIVADVTTGFGGVSISFIWEWGINGI